MTRIETDILIIGVGSGGFGALYNALTFGDKKIKITAIDKNPDMGGTSTYAGVCVWEPGIGGPGVHYKLADLLLVDRQNGFVSKGMNTVTEQVRWGSSGPCDDEYESTLNRSLGKLLGRVRRFSFKPDAMVEAMHKLVNGFDNFKFLPNVEYISSVQKSGRITAVLAENIMTGEEYEIVPKLVVDASADIVAARSSGCSYAFGEDSMEIHNEPNAPTNESQTINGVTQMFTVVPCDEGYIQEIPEDLKDVDVTAWLENVRKTNLPLSCFYYYMDNTISVNMLPTIEGIDLISLGNDNAQKVCKDR